MKKVYLIILDGFGFGKHDRGDAVFQAQKPFLNEILEKYPMAQLKTYGKSVGLPEFQTGGSEVGHITIGSGRVIKHLLTKINDKIESGAFFKNSKLTELFEKAKKKGRIHFYGLASDGGIHSFLPHLFGLQKMAKKYGIPEIYIHAVLDGRDVGERTAKEFLVQIEEQKAGIIATVGGRFFGMDRDQNWDREEKHYRVLTDKKTTGGKDWQKELKKFYKETDKSDYYFPPILCKEEGQIREDDILICFNFRVDRMREIVEALTAEKFKHFPREVILKTENIGVFGKYGTGTKMIFSEKGEKSPKNTLGEVFSKLGLKQLRISETEKFNHVTFYFSGQRKEEFKGEERIMVPSPKCATYATKPAMSAREQTKKVITEIKKKKFSLIVQNFANADLVGHSGNLEAAEKGVRVLDECIKKIIPVALKADYEIILTADHGNADEMIYPNGEESASHTKNPVPCVWITKNPETKKLKPKGFLYDIAPTLCELAGIKIPKEMTGKSLIK